MRRWVSLKVNDYRIVVTEWPDGTKELEWQKVIARTEDSIQWITVGRL